MKAREFSISCDNKDREKGATKTGVPQGSPLSPVLFLIWMTPILSKIEKIVYQMLKVDIELPSYVDDIHLCIYD